MSQTVFNQFLTDNETTQALSAVMAKLEGYQQQLKGICPPKEGLQASYDETVAGFAEYRGGKLFFPYLSSGLGKGPLVELADGSVKYDFIIGIGVHIMGHSHPGLIEACLKASLADTVMQGNLQQNTDSYEFTDMLLKAANTNGAGFDHCFLTSSGAMAGENAVKIAFQKKAPAQRLLAFHHCFMGRTLAMASATDKAAYRVGLPKTLEVDYVPFFDVERPEESTKEAVAVLQKHLAAHPGEYAAMCFELIQGEGGFNVGDRDFFLALIKVLKEHKVAVLVDEVQTFTRSTELFAYQYFGLDEYVDIVWLGKASQVCATLYRKDFNPKPGLLSQTYTASTTALAAGKYILNHLLEGGYYGEGGKIAKLHQYVRGKLQAIAEKHPDLVSGPYGIGAMCAFTPLGGNPEIVKKFTNALYANGVMGFFAGSDPLRFRFLLPFCVVTEQDIDTVMNVVEKTLLEVKE
jgi:4-aminobutyrate aminotransferase-like enzyme